MSPLWQLLGMTPFWNLEQVVFFMAYRMFGQIGEGRRNQQAGRKDTEEPKEKEKRKAKRRTGSRERRGEREGRVQPVVSS